jgi:hypothetical protein
MFPRSLCRPMPFESRVSPYSIAGKPLRVVVKDFHLLSYTLAARAAIDKFTY